MTLSSRSESGRLVLRRALTILVIGVALSSIKHGAWYPTGVLQHIAGYFRKDLDEAVALGEEQEVELRPDGAGSIHARITAEAS